MAGESTSLSNLSTVYTWVVDDVIKHVRAEFLNEGVDEQVLEELKQLWLAKIDLTKAVSRPQASDPLPLPPPLQPTNPPPSSRSSPRVDPAKELPPVPPLIERPLQIHQESVIQHAPRQFQTTPTTPSSFSSSSPSASSAILIPSGYSPAVPVVPITGGGGAIAVTTHTGITRPMPQFMPQIMAAGGFPQGAQVIVPTSQGPVVMHLPLSTVLAMQQQQAQAMVAAQGQAQADRGGGGEGGLSSGEHIRQSDGPPPPLSLSGEEEKEKRGEGGGGGMEVLHEGVTGTVLDDRRLSVGSMQQDARDYSHPRADTTAISPPNNPFKDSQSANPELTMPSSQSKPTRKSTTSEILSSNPRRDKYLWASSHGDGVREEEEETISQVDGHGKGMGRTESSSEEESEGDDDTSDEDELEPAHDSDPLGSDDDIDVGSEKSEEDFETQDSVICQWEKVYRVKTKWKFNLKDGVMHIAGHDYIFQKITGEADW